MSQDSPSRLPAISSAVFVLLGLLLLGGASGLLLAARVFRSASAMGWDQLGHVFGGLLLGGLTGGVLGAVLIVRLTIRARWLVGAGSTVAAAVIVVLLVATAPGSRTELTELDEMLRRVGTPAAVDS